MRSRSWLKLRPWQRHSMVLVVAGLVYVGIGYSFFTAEPSTTRTTALQYILYWLPLKGWGVVFACVGVAAIASARWPPYNSTWGYIALTGLSGAWSAAYFCGIAFAHTPQQNWAQVLTWALISFMWWAISGLVNPLLGGSSRGS